MTKSALVELLAEKNQNFTKKQVEFIINEVFKQIKTALKNNDNVEIRGFGSFKFREKSEKIGRNPRTGEQLTIPPKKIPYFKPGKDLKESLIKSQFNPSE